MATREQDCRPRSAGPAHHAGRLGCGKLQGAAHRQWLGRGGGGAGGAPGLAGSAVACATTSPSCSCITRPRLGVRIPRSGRSLRLGYVWPLQAVPGAGMGHTGVLYARRAKQVCREQAKQQPQSADSGLCQSLRSARPCGRAPGHKQGSPLARPHATCWQTAFTAAGPSGCQQPAADAWSQQKGCGLRRRSAPACWPGAHHRHHRSCSLLPSRWCAVQPGQDSGQGTDPGSAAHSQASGHLSGDAAAQRAEARRPGMAFAPGARLRPWIVRRAAARQAGASSAGPRAAASACGCSCSCTRTSGPVDCALWCKSGRNAMASTSQE